MTVGHKFVQQSFVEQIFVEQNFVEQNFVQQKFVEQMINLFKIDQLLNKCVRGWNLVDLLNKW